MPACIKLGIVCIGNQSEGYIDYILNGVTSVAIKGWNHIVFIHSLSSAEVWHHASGIRKVHKLILPVHYITDSIDTYVR